MAVVRAALAAAGKLKEPTVLGDVIMQLGCPKTKNTAHQALIEYGEIAVEPLGEVLLDSSISRDVRLNIPSTLSQIASTSAMNALVNALNQEDGSLRYRIIVGLEEIARRLPNFRIDRRAIENAIDAEASHYYRRFVTFFVLFGDDNDAAMKNGSLLHQALLSPPQEPDGSDFLIDCSRIPCSGQVRDAGMSRSGRWEPLPRLSCCPIQGRCVLPALRYSFPDLQ